MLQEWCEYNEDNASEEDPLYEIRCASSLHSHCSSIEERQQEIHENNLLYAQLYYNRVLDCLEWGSQVIEGTLGPVSRLSENLALNVVDAFHNHITKNKVKAAVMLSDADFQLYLRGKKLDKFLQAQLRNGGYELLSEMFIDYCIFGFSAAKVEVVTRGGKDEVLLTRLFPDDVIIDQRECHGDAKPMHYFYRRVMPVDSAVRQFGLDRAEAETAAAANYLDFRPKAQHNIIVIEAWRVAYYDQNGKLVPGKHIIATNNKVILVEDFKDECPPIVFGRWRKPSSGFHGPSAVEEVLPYQIRLNEINETIREAQDLMIRPRLLAPSNAKLAVNQIDNEIAKIITYTPGAKPEAVVWPAVNPELYNERDRVVKSCYEFIGLSQLAAQAKLPSGARFDSSLAIREFNTTQDGRHAKRAQDWEMLTMDLCKKIIEVCHAHKASIVVRNSSVGNSSLTEELDFADIDYDASLFQLYLEPASVINETPAARKEMLLELLQRGVITPARYAYLWKSPDIDAEMSMAAAAEEDIEFTIDQLEQGEYVPPDEFTDLASGLFRVQKRLLKLKKFKNLDENVLANFQRWLLTAESLLPKPPPQPEMAPVPGAPMPAPAPGI